MYVRAGVNVKLNGGSIVVVVCCCEQWDRRRGGGGSGDGGGKWEAKRHRRVCAPSFRLWEFISGEQKVNIQGLHGVLRVSLYAFRLYILFSKRFRNGEI